MNNDSVKIILAIFLICLFAFIGVKQGESERQKIHTFLMEKKGATQVVSVERCIVDKGPWWWYADEDATIYYATYKDKQENHKSIYFLFDFWGMRSSED